MIEPLIVKHSFPKIVGIIEVIFCISCAVMAWRAGEFSALAIFVPVSFLGIYLILAPGRLVIDDEGITHERPFSHHSIKWDEILLVETDYGGNLLTFSGHDKRLVTLGPHSGCWNGKDRVRAVTFLMSQLRRRGAELRVSGKFRLPFNKNVKVDRL